MKSYQSDQFAVLDVSITVILGCIYAGQFLPSALVTGRPSISSDRNWPSPISSTIYKSQIHYKRHHCQALLAYCYCSAGDIIDDLEITVNICNAFVVNKDESIL